VPLSSDERYIKGSGSSHSLREFEDPAVAGDFYCKNGVKRLLLFDEETLGKATHLDSDLWVDLGDMR